MRTILSFFLKGLAIAALTLVVGCGTDDGVDAEGVDQVADDAAAPGDDEDHGDEDHGDDDDHDDDDHDDHDDHDDDDHDDHDEEGSSGLGAHEHGVAELSVAWSENDMVVDFISPTANVFGFEYEPTSDEDLAIVADRTEALTAPGVMTINPEAGCNLVGEAETDLEYEGSHAEITASWFFACSDPDAIRQIDLAGLFAEFPALEDVDAQWASPSAQSAAELSPSAPVLELG